MPVGVSNLVGGLVGGLELGMGSVFAPLYMLDT